MSLAGLRGAGAVLGLAMTAQAGAGDCLPPDEGSLPYRRAVSRIKYLPETEAWRAAITRSEALVRYVLHLDETRRVARRCYWTLEVWSGDALWQRFLVSPDGEDVRVQSPRGPLRLPVWRAALRACDNCASPDLPRTPP